jgi:hypothetical protein
MKGDFNNVMSQVDHHNQQLVETKKETMSFTAASSLCYTSEGGECHCRKLRRSCRDSIIDILYAHIPYVKMSTVF